MKARFAAFRVLQEALLFSVIYLFIADKLFCRQLLLAKKMHLSAFPFSQLSRQKIPLSSVSLLSFKGFQLVWDFVMTIISISNKLLEEWPGLHLCVKTPCRTAGCPAEFVWPDVDDKSTV